MKTKYRVEYRPQGQSGVSYQRHGEYESPEKANEEAAKLTKDGADTKITKIKSL